jgi:hypothetical protein
MFARISRHVRVASFHNGRFMLAFGLWPIADYGGFGFSIVLLWWEVAVYVNPRGFDSEKVVCPKCEWSGTEDELIDGETCPICKLVLPE